MVGNSSVANKQLYLSQYHNEVCTAKKCELVLLTSCTVNCLRALSFVFLLTMLYLKANKYFIQFFYI